VNLSANDIGSVSAIEQIVALCAKARGDCRIDFEITETALLRDLKQAHQSLLTLLGLGARIALDDFGTGHSSLTNVQKLPLHRIKIDRSFVAEVNDDPASRAIVKTMIDLCRNLGISCVFEGIETESQLKTLVELGGTIMQGYLFGRPMLGEQVGVDTLPIVTTETPVEIARRAEREGRLGGYDVLLLEAAGRTHIDDELMAETVSIKEIARPHEILLVVDALTGQDAINVARSFDDRLDVTGIVMTRVDGDGRGGAALSMRAATGKPIKLIGVGEKMDALEDFHPARIADRILALEDIVSLVEKAAEHVSVEDAQKMAKKLKKGSFDLEDLRAQLIQMKKMGGMGGLMGLLPGAGQLKKAMAGANVDEKVFDRQIAIINSMTKKERENPDLLNASRRKRIAAGAGVEVSEINKLAKQHRQMADMMKKVGKGGMGALGGMFGGKMGQMMGGMPDLSKMDPKQLEQMARQAGINPEQLKGLPSADLPAPKALPTDVNALLKSSGGPALPGLGGAPRFPGLPGLGKKK